MPLNLAVFFFLFLRGGRILALVSLLPLQAPVVLTSAEGRGRERERALMSYYRRTYAVGHRSVHLQSCTCSFFCGANGVLYSTPI